MSDRWTLHEGDCLPWLRAMGDASIDVVLTDPPYREGVHEHLKSNSGGFEHKVDCTFAALTDDLLQACAVEFARLSRRWVLVFSAVEQTHLWRDALTGAGLQYVRTLFYRRQRVTPQISGDRPAHACEVATLAHRPGRKRWNGGGKPGFYEHMPENRRDTGHPTAKPLRLMLDLVADFTEPGDLVLDPFAGTATTGVAALRLGRRFAGAEAMPEYAALSRRRLEAEERGLSLLEADRGQIALFDAPTRAPR